MVPPPAQRRSAGSQPPRPKTAARPSGRRRRPDWTPPTRARVVRIRERLRAVYGIPLTQPHGDPIAELVLTVLSQSTNDRNRDVAYLRLRDRFAGVGIDRAAGSDIRRDRGSRARAWERVRDAPLAEVERAIRPGGISKVKSARIQAILRAISASPRDAGAEAGDRLSLDWLPPPPGAPARGHL